MAILNEMSEADVARFRSKVDKSGGPDACWPWTDAPATIGYGYLGVGGRKGRKIQAHKIAYELAGGVIPDGYQIDHTCRNRRCENPRHLEAVPQRVNLLRGEGASAKNAVKTHCLRGHAFDGKNTILWGRRRQCRTCANLTRRLKRQEAKTCP